MTISDFSDQMYSGGVSRAAQRQSSDEPALVIQILSVFGFGVFSIVAVSLAFAAFWGAGLIVAALIAWTWAGSRMFGGRQPGGAIDVNAQAIRDLAPAVPGQASSGNASFDAYRAEVLDRLEHESAAFGDFLTRLRQARDATEFDQFMDDRASAAREIRELRDDEISQ